MMPSPVLPLVLSTSATYLIVTDPDIAVRAEKSNDLSLLDKSVEIGVPHHTSGIIFKNRTNKHSPPPKTVTLIAVIIPYFQEIRTVENQLFLQQNYYLETRLLDIKSPPPPWGVHVMPAWKESYAVSWEMK